MAAVATIVDQYDDGRRLVVEGTMVFSGSYVVGGEIPTYAGLRTSKSTPTRIFFNGVAASYQFQYDPLTGKVLIFQGDNANASPAPGLQLTAAAYPAGLTGSITYFMAYFKKP